MNITITSEQIAERDAWEARLKLGQCNLADALLMTLHIGTPASPYLLARVEEAFTTYNEGAYDDLATPFGCAVGQREKKQNEHETHRSNVKFHVKSFNEQGYPILNPNNNPDTESAFTKTADLLKNVSAATAFDIHYDRDIKKRKARR